ncbi:MAG: thiol peroxidase [Bacteroidales bacterium]
MKETKNVTSQAGGPLTLLGEPTIIGEIAPNFTAVDITGNSIQLNDFKGKTVVLAVFPSIDTKVCAMETREFNKRATSLGDDVVVLTLSKDLPFALGRFCAAEGIKNVIPLSDYIQSEFGLKYGFLIKENMLLARGVIIVDKLGKVVYVEYVNDIIKEPNYDAAIEHLKRL